MCLWAWAFTAATSRCLADGPGLPCSSRAQKGGKVGPALEKPANKSSLPQILWNTKLLWLIFPSYWTQTSRCFQKQQPFVMEEGDGGMQMAKCFSYRHFCSQNTLSQFIYPGMASSRCSWWTEKLPFPKTRCASYKKHNKDCYGACKLFCHLFCLLTIFI